MIEMNESFGMSRIVTPYDAAVVPKTHNNDDSFVLFFSLFYVRSFVPNAEPKQIYEDSINQKSKWKAVK